MFVRSSLTLVPVKSKFALDGALNGEQMIYLMPLALKGYFFSI